MRVNPTRARDERSVWARASAPRLLRYGTPVRGYGHWFVAGQPVPSVNGQQTQTHAVEPETEAVAALAAAVPEPVTVPGSPEP